MNAFLSRALLLVTSHVTSNVRVEVKEGADSASLTNHTLAYHVLPEDTFKKEDTSYTVSCLYSMDLVKNATDGLWKIKKWDFNILWTTGDRAITSPDA